MSDHDSAFSIRDSQDAKEATTEQLLTAARRLRVWSMYYPTTESNAIEHELVNRFGFMRFNNWLHRNGNGEI